MAPSSDGFGSDGFSPNSGTNRPRQAMATDTSPDSKCPICLDGFENVAYLNCCYHSFCFRCVQEWSKNKAECPLCKQPFHSIIHSMRSDDDFKEYIVRPSEDGSFASPNGRRFLVFKTYHAGTFIFFRILIPFWLSQYYVKYHLLILLTTVLLSWGYVIYATRLAAQWQLKDDYPTQTHNFCETLKQGDL
ncbi:PREDICTED: E3 ubiquitin-protein ligase Topors-like isoform X1 [Gekko japonicus]|uniref:RING-type E3 ubiquitin transferase n=1 Tax=Gekko japonicus TaxID=146911 RepID=A0ABM1JUZ1_GEKJA|nr:PREDICTED: E3 ubiquitin-protein ligase Topors-like isoform X1 [Gekko japonicus]